MRMEELYDISTACTCEGVNGFDLNFFPQFLASTGYIFSIFRSNDVPEILYGFFMRMQAESRRSRGRLAMKNGVDQE
jgi:hypothetical protein